MISDATFSELLRARAEAPGEIARAATDRRRRTVGDLAGSGGPLIVAALDRTARLLKGER
jgi:hypothetical protein